MGESPVPNIMRIGRYVVFFWSNENNEPIHVHICEGQPTANATKVWLTAAGGCVLANNSSRIPQQELNDLMDVISANFFRICKKWKDHFLTDTISFYA